MSALLFLSPQHWCLIYLVYWSLDVSPIECKLYEGSGLSLWAYPKHLERYIKHSQCTANAQCTWVKKKKNPLNGSTFEILSRSAPIPKYEMGVLKIWDEDLGWVRSKQWKAKETRLSKLMLKWLHTESPLSNTPTKIDRGLSSSQRKCGAQEKRADMRKWRSQEWL